MRSGSILHRKSERFKTWDFPNDTCNLLEYSDASKKDEGEIDCYASEEDDEGTKMAYNTESIFLAVEQQIL